MLLLLHSAVATAAAACRSRTHRFTHDPLVLADVLLAVLAEHGLVVEGNAGTQTDMLLCC
jgi:hypothetical protein